MRRSMTSRHEAEELGAVALELGEPSLSNASITTRLPTSQMSLSVTHDLLQWRADPMAPRRRATGDTGTTRASRGPRSR
jgi:hypothetical protein